VNELVCDITTSKNSNLPSKASFTANGATDLTKFVGVSLSGVPILNGLSLNNVDPLYPAIYGTVTNIESAKESFDTCLGHPSSSGMYHYHAMAPCNVDDTYGSPPKSCSSSASCSANALTYGESAYDEKDGLNPIGIAKDGHIIWGVYDSNGALWDDCDIDVCNGAIIDGSYGYVASDFHPYFVGCWGPGNSPSYS